MNRTVKFVLIVISVSGAASFLLTMLSTGSASRANPTFVAAIFGMVAGVAFLLLTGNRKVKIADSETRRLALVGTQPPAGMAHVLVVRQVMVGVLIGVDVIIDGTVVVQLKSPRFTMLTYPAGSHQVVAVAQGRSTRPMPLDLKAGETAVVRISAGFGGVKLSREPDGLELRASLAKMPMVEPRPHVSLNDGP